MPAAATPEIGEQVAELARFAAAALEERCPKWTAAQRSTYVDGLRFGLLGGLARALDAGEVAALETGLEADAESYRDCSPGEGDELADQELSLAAMKWMHAHRAYWFARRACSDTAAGSAQEAIDQLPRIAELVMEGLREGLPEVSPETVEEAVLRWVAVWEANVRSPLTTGMKRPLTPEELADVRIRTPDQCERARGMAERRAKQGGSAADDLNTQALNMALSEVNSMLLGATRAPSSPAYEQYLAVMASIRRQHTGRQAEWMERQGANFKHNFVASLVAPSVETNERMLTLLEPLFSVPSLMGPDGLGIGY